jgi:two-component system phosphate regulon sensor histidine kinase PhoR
LLALALGLVLWLWRRSRAAQTAAEVTLAQAERSLRGISLTAETYAAQLEALSEAHLDPELVVAADGSVLEANPAARRLFGAHTDPGSSLIVYTRSAELDELFAHSLAGGADCDRQVRIGSASAPYRARAIRVHDPQQRPQHAGVILSLHDLSELQRLGRARRDFVANISHELRTPITSIRLLVDTLRGTTDLEEAAHDEMLEKISIEAEALAQLAQELLDLAQIESGQALVRLVPTQVADLARTVTDRFSAQAARKQQTVAVDVSPHLWVWADAAQMPRALGNLLHNAIKYTPPGGAITVSAAAADGDVIIAVVDTGPGIAPEDQARVFERFFQGDRSRTGGGTGLGLAIARHVVEAHGGRIWVESDGRPGQGAIFRLTLPAAQPDALGGAE